MGLDRTKKELALLLKEKEQLVAQLIIANDELKKAEEALNQMNVELEQRVLERTETALKTLEEKNAILESIGDAFFAVDKSWKVTYWNKIAEIALQMLKQDIVGRNLWEVFSGSVDSLSYQKYHEAMATDQVVHFEDFYAVLEKWYEISVYPSEIGLSVFFKDISERKKATAEIKLLNEELEKRVLKRTEALMIANRELEQFSYIASHDLQEPLRTVSNYMMVFEEEYIDLLDENALKYLHSVNNATQRMSALIKSLLDFSRLGYNTKLAYVDCRHLIDDVLLDLEMMVTTSKAQIEIFEMPKLNLYEIEIRQVFQNLIANAIKFKKNNSIPKIEIRSEMIEDGWKFSVRDNGIGIQPIHFERIFDIFQRLHTNDKYHGNGIGLSNCKKIIQAHQGKIWVESTLQQGSTFYFTIPNLKL